MEKHELMDKLEDLQIEAWEENTGSNEADLGYREKVYSFIEGLLKNNGVLIDVNHQREQFIDFLQWLNSDKTDNLKSNSLEEIVDAYMKIN